MSTTVHADGRSFTVSNTTPTRWRDSGRGERVHVRNDAGRLCAVAIVRGEVIEYEMCKPGGLPRDVVKAIYDEGGGTDPARPKKTDVSSKRAPKSVATHRRRNPKIHENFASQVPVTPAYEPEDDSAAD